MCNLYDIGPKPSRLSKDWKERVAEALGKLPAEYGIRRTDPGVVARMNRFNERIEPAVMRWGFHRDFSPAINNARLDKLEGNMWNKAWRERRCVIPVSAFYEWSGSKGARQTHAFQAEPENDQETDWLWMAGVWEPNEEFGECFSMITTAASGVIAPIHNRMPAILKSEAIEEFLKAPADEASESWLAGILDDRLRTFQCLNPLKTNKPGPPVEDLFLF